MERRLTTILAADVAGYTLLMEDDESGTLDELKHRRSQIIAPLLAKCDGRIIKDIGDGFLAEFASVVNAVHFAIDLQAASEARNDTISDGRRMRYRIGVNLSDVIADANDVFGDGVNLASRLEGLAEPGGICISDTVYHHVRRHLSFAFEDIGKRHLKNISGEVQVYRVVLGGVNAVRGRQGSKHQASIVVLPFNNMSGDPAQDYFSDGITEDIITDLSKVSSLFVVARNTAFTFKGSHVEVEAVANRLGVQFVLEGSVRTAGSRVRITAQLIDGRTSGHIWAERFDREFKDIFELQDEISRAIVSALRLKLLPSEAETLAQRATHHPDAYRYYLMGRAFCNRSHTRRMLRLARQMFSKALEADPNFARALAGIADCNSLLLDAGDISVSCAEIIDQSERALAIDPSLAEAHASRGLALYTAGRYKDAEVSFASAMELQPDLFEARLFCGRNSFVQKNYLRAIECFAIAADINRDDFRALGLQAMCYQSLGRPAEALATARQALIRAERAVMERPDDADALSFGAGLLAMLGEQDRTRDWAERAAIIEPDDVYLQYNLACAYAVLGDVGSALDRLEDAMGKAPLRSLIEYMQSDSDLDVLRDEPRYHVMVARLMEQEAQLVP
jgi:adenylate cyclase